MTETKFVECEKCFAIVKRERIDGHAKWHSKVSAKIARVLQEARRMADPRNFGWMP